MIRGPVQFLLDANGRPQYAVLSIEDYWALTGDAEAIGEPEPRDPLGRDAPAFEVPEQVAAAVAGGAHPVAAWREYRGLTQEILAGWIGFDEEDVAHFEENDAVPTVEILQMIANALNVPIQALLPPQEG
ncbi:MAG TPA: helix-turn-helix transcriptional regulator [Alphaproteobacteria bacterium]|nr:helix-turn-helix transcriptional regulator [Alphaproteobacteria bacterium]